MTKHYLCESGVTIYLIKTMLGKKNFVMADLTRHPENSGDSFGFRVEPGMTSFSTPCSYIMSQTGNYVNFKFWKKNPKSFPCPHY